MARRPQQDAKGRARRLITNTVDEALLRDAGRLDARYFTDKGWTISQRVKRGPWRRARLGELVGDKNVFAPPRFARVYASDPRFGKPYLAPSDALRYMPEASDYLSESQTRHFAEYEIQRGWLLLTCSGRNLGPCLWVDQYLERFVISHDMIRIRADAESDDAFYVLALLHTSSGRELIRRDRNGSVIDHIDANQVRSVTVPIVDDALVKRCADGFRRAALLRERSRLTLSDAKDRYAVASGLLDAISRLGNHTRDRRHAINQSQLGWRIDAEPHLPRYAGYVSAIRATGFDCSLTDVAYVVKPPGRYRTYYVDQPEFGTPLLSGRQVAQYRPVGLKHISPASFTDPTAYTLRAGWVLMTADGRAEDHLADCAIVTSDREGWAASGHVFRLKPRPAIHPGLLYLAVSADVSQEILKSRAVGSVVDALWGEDVESVVIPYCNTPAALAIADQVVLAWHDFARASDIEDTVVQALETELVA